MISKTLLVLITIVSGVSIASISTDARNLCIKDSGGYVGSEIDRTL